MILKSQLNPKSPEFAQNAASKLRDWTGGDDGNARLTARH